MHPAGLDAAEPGPRAQVPKGAFRRARRGGRRILSAARAIVKRRGVLLIVLAVGAAPGCGREPQAVDGTIPRERFVEVSVALRQIDADSATVDSVRAEVLARHGVTAEQLRDFVHAHGERPAELAAIWDEIARRLQEAEAAAAPGAEAVEEATDSLLAPDTLPAREPTPDAAEAPAAPRGPARAVMQQIR